MELINRIQCHADLTQTERHLRDYILRYPENVARMNVRSLAQASFSSPSSVIRFCQKFGYKGLKDFKADLFAGSGPGADDALPDCDYPFTADTPAEDVTAAVLSIEQESLHRLRHLLDQGTLDRAVDMLMKASRIELCAIGTSGHMSSDFAFRMMKLGRRISTISEWVELKYAAQQMDSSHCLMVVSYSGANNHLRISMNAAKNNGVPILAVTARPDSDAARMADCVLLLPPMESNDDKISTFASAIAEKAMLDVLFAHIFQRDYDQNVAFVQSDAQRLLDVRTGASE